MRRFADIIANSLRMALLELWKNKLRTFLSLFGITIGIFCIIGVLATVNSLEYNIQREIRSLGTNTLYVDKWEYGGGPDYPWWKYVKRPSPQYEEMLEIKRRSFTAGHTAFVINTGGQVEVKDQVVSGVILYGVTEEFPDIQPVDIQYGRMMSPSEYQRGANAAVIGTELAEKLFGEASIALGRQVVTRGRNCTVVGIVRKQGKQLIGGWQFDQAMILSYQFARTFMEERRSDPLILVKGRDGISSKVLKDELAGVMRSIRRLNPTQEDNFALNDVNDFSEMMSQAFVAINIGGAIIGGISLLVGLFGVANIMFVSVKERTSQIGLKKAIGAKNSVILNEFLLEAAFLCLIGGIMGVLMVFAGAKVATALLDFPIFISGSMLVLALFICIAVGLISGIVPAYRAAKMDPVVAIRSN
jgi:putative ABC transport system permease protein